MPGRPHHTEKMHRCVDEVMAKGHDESSAYAICTTSLTKAGEDVLVAASVRNLHLRGASGTCRSETIDGREHLIVPVTALMEGVIHAVNAETPEFVSAAALTKSTDAWTGHPVVLGHPVKNGKQISAHNPEVLEQHGFGVIRQPYMNGARLGMEAVIDPDRLTALKQDQLLADLRAGKPIEVSVGAFVTTNDKADTYQGRPYKAEWLTITPDHLALLPKGIGACSMAMGCGAHRAAMRVLESGFELEPPTFREKFKSLLDSLRTAGPLPDRSQVAVGAKVVVNHPGHKQHGKSGVVTKSLKGGLVHTVDGLGTFHLSKLKAAASDVADTPAEAASEEAAELVSYKALRVLFDQVNATYDEASNIIDDLIADEVENPTSSSADEEAEEEVEAARLEAIQVLCMSMYSTLNSVMDLTRNLLTEDVVDQSAQTPRYMATMVDCAACGGTGNVRETDKDSNPCEVCDGNGQLKVAAGARHSAEDRTMIQGVHDHAVALGADCSPKDYKLMSTKEPILKAACRCQEGESAMTKDQKTEAIKALIADKHSGFTADDEKMLDTASDERIESFKVAAAARATEVRTAEEKATADAAKAAETEAKLKAAETRPLTEDEFMKVAPAPLKALIERSIAQDTARKAELVTTLKTAQAEFSESELAAESLERLERMARALKVHEPKPDYSGRAMPRTAAAEDYTPPDPYAADVKALRARDSVN